MEPKATSITYLHQGQASSHFHRSLSSTAPKYSVLYYKLYRLKSSLLTSQHSHCVRLHTDPPAVHIIYLSFHLNNNKHNFVWPSINSQQPTPNNFQVGTSMSLLFFFFERSDSTHQPPPLQNYAFLNVPVI